MLINIRHLLFILCATVATLHVTPLPAFAEDSSANAQSKTFSSDTTASPNLEKSMGLETSAGLESQRKVERIGTALPSASEQLSAIGRGLAYCLVIGLVGYAIVQKLKKNSNLPDASGINIISRKAIGPRTILLVAEIADKRFFLAQTTDNVSLLAELDPFGLSYAHENEATSDVTGTEQTFTLATKETSAKEAQ